MLRARIALLPAPRQQEISSASQCPITLAFYICVTHQYITHHDTWRAVCPRILGRCVECCVREGVCLCHFGSSHTGSRHPLLLIMYLYLFAPTRPPGQKQKSTCCHIGRRAPLWSSVFFSQPHRAKNRGAPVAILADVLLCGHQFLFHSRLL